MMRAWLLALAALMPAAALAQQDQEAPIIATPLMPPSSQNPSALPSPTPPQPRLPGPPSAQAPSQAMPPVGPMSSPWQPQSGAVLQALDKINAQYTTLTIKDGQSATFGSLKITVNGCFVRPPKMPQDATANLTITDSHADEPGFHGWMVKSDPAMSMLEHPIYDVRVIGCT